MTATTACQQDLERLPGAAPAQTVADKSRLPVALLASADTDWTTAETVDVAGPAFTICRYGDDSHTEVHRLPGLAVGSERRRERFVRALLAATVPDGEAAGFLSVFLHGRLQEAVVRADETWRCYAAVTEQWLVLAVVPAVAGKGTAPNLVLVHPAAQASGRDRGGRRVRQTRTFTVIGDSTGGRPLVFDPLTGAAHRGPQPLPCGRVAMDHQQVTGWPEERHAPVLAVSGPSRLFPDPHQVLPALDRAGIVAVNLLATRLDEDLVHLARLLNRAGLLVTVTTNRPGLPQLAEGMAGAVHALRVQLHAPTESEHDRLALPHQASWEDSLTGIRAVVDAGLPVQLLVEAPPLGAGDTERLILANAAAHRAAELRVCGLTLLPRPGTRPGRPPRRGTGRVPEAGGRLLRRTGSTGLAVATRIGIGRAERPESGLGALAVLGAALAVAEVA